MGTTLHFFIVSVIKTNWEKYAKCLTEYLYIESAHAKLCPYARETVIDIIVDHRISIKN